MENLNKTIDQSDASYAEEDCIIECRNIVKKFPGNLALDSVNVKVRRGEVHALVGQNGAGKSTLVKIITGVFSHDEGSIIVDGKEIKLNNPQDAERAGIAIIHQDQQLVPQFDVTRNVFLGREIKKNGIFLDFKAMKKATQEVLDRIAVEFGPDELICNLTVGQREQIAIASALLRQPKVLILDEPTASLSRKEVQKLFDIIRNLKESGVTIIYISHHFDEVFEISDRITVLRDGKKISTMNVCDCNKAEVIKVMIGREISQLYPKETVQQGEVILEIKDLKLDEKVNGVDLELHRGEILGIAGILGSGTAEIANSLFGVNKATSGEIIVNGTTVAMVSPRVAKKSGLALIPEDRRNEGLVSNMSIMENLSLAYAKQFATKGVLKKSIEKERSQKIIKLLNIKAYTTDQMVDTLSGGNQQKVVIGRWLSGNSEVFILNQPTTGVDVGSKVEIYKAMSELVKNGAGIIVISQDFDELLGMSDRILVVSKGKIVKSFSYGEATSQELLHYATSNSLTESLERE